MYAARDITNTVGCLGLIVSSIISKKVTGSLSLYPLFELSTNPREVFTDSIM